jgi:hypothetical protein
VGDIHEQITKIVRRRDFVILLGCAAAARRLTGVYPADSNANHL